MSFPCRLIVDPPQDGPWNMAVDEALLETAAKQGIATLRFYVWSEPTLSLGYFQRCADREGHEASRACPAVRRPSGGGAILHDREVTYSLALPAGHPLSVRADRSYALMHDALVAVLNEFLSQESGQIAQICTSNASPPAEPFLCFLRRTRGDVLIRDKREGGTTCKIAGSAQRRRRGAVLQHGSVLLAGSLHAPELPGIMELTHREMAPQDFTAVWADRLRSDLNVSLKPSGLATTETARAAALATERFASSAWTNRR